MKQSTVPASLAASPKPRTFTNKNATSSGIIFLYNTMVTCTSHCHLYDSLLCVAYDHRSPKQENKKLKQQLNCVVFSIVWSSDLVYYGLTAHSQQIVDHRCLGFSGTFIAKICNINVWNKQS